MADELTIGVNQPQVQKSNPAPYVIGGGLIGAAAGYGVNHFTTKPQYESFEDIVKEAEDTFENKAKEAAEDQKGIWEKAKEARKAGVEAGENWDKEFAAYKEANKEGATPQLAADHELMKEKSTLENTIKELEGKPAETATKAKEPLAELRQATRELNNASDDLKKLKANGGTEEAIKKAQERVTNQQARLNTAYDTILEKVEFKGTEKEIEAAKKDFRAKLEGYTQEYMTAYDKYSTKKPVKAHIKAKADIKNANESIESSLKKIEEISGYKVKDSIGNEKQFAKRIEVIEKIEKNKIDILNEMSKKYNKLPNKKKLTFVQKIQNIMAAANGEKPAHVKGTDSAELEKFVEQLTKEEKALLKDNGVSKETFEELIKAAEDRLKGIDEAVKSIETNKGAIETANKEIAKALTDAKAKYGTEAYFNEAGEICVKGKPVEKPATMKLPELEKEVFKKLPKEIEVTTKGRSAADTKAINEAKDKLKQVETKITEARNQLPKVEAKTEEQLIEDFVKNKGKREDAVKKAGEAFKDDIKSLFEKKINNKKLAGWMTGGAAALALLGYLVAPKNKEV